MEWQKSYLDMVLVPMGLLLPVFYHIWLWQKVRSQPEHTVIGINSAGRRLWVLAMMKDIDRRNILIVQTLRNAIMGSTLMATTSILLCTGLAAILSSTYSIKQPISNTVYGAHGELVVAVKYVSLLVFFLFTFLFYSLAIWSLTQVGFLASVAREDGSSPVTPEHVSSLLERGFALNTAGNRLFFAALPILLWIFGPVLVFLCHALLIPVLYNMDIVYEEGKGGVGGKAEKIDGKSSEVV